MKGKMKRIGAMLLAVAMVLGLMQVNVNTVSAEEAGGVNTPTTTVVNRTVVVNVTADETVDYTVTLPAGYDEKDKNRHYPVLYLMPDDGLDTVSETMKTELSTVMEGNTAVDMIIVQPELKAGMDVYAAVSKIIADVDKNYATIADPSARAVMGTLVGGYLADILTWTDGAKNVVSGPVLFGASASINGDFQSDANIWKDKYGDFYDIMTDNDTGNGKLSNNLATQFYTFMDSASEDERAYTKKGANDVISYFINRGAAYGGFFYGYYGNADADVLELTVKNGEYDDAFIKTSIEEAVNGISNKMVQGMVSGSLKLTPQAAYAKEESIEAVYNLEVSDLYTKYCADVENDLTLTISMTDADTGDAVETIEPIKVKVKEGTFTNAENPVSLPNTINNVSTTVTLTAEVLGKEIEIDSKPLVRIAETGTEAEDQLVDLLGAWKFQAAKSVEYGVLPTEAEYSEWEEVYPCLDWWQSDFAESQNMKAYSGYAWYVKEFTIPADFPEGEYIVPVGYFDETDVCFINGKQIGITGLDPDTWQHQADCWDTERIYSISSEDLNIGGKNVMIVLTHNQSGDGGWYDGHPGLYSTAAYNKMTSKPSTVAGDTQTKAVKDTVEKQIKAIESKDIDAYAATIDPEYFQSGITKEMQVEEVAAYLEGDGEVTVKDTEQYVFEKDDLYFYQAKRSITKADGGQIETDVEEYYQITDGVAVLYGEHDRFFTQYIDSEYRASALGTGNTVETENFLVYLPEGYFDEENADKRYPTAYVFHQINSSSNSYAIDGINEYLDEGIESGAIKDTILIIPDSSASSWWRGDWIKMVTEEILPFVDSHYRTIQDARYRFTAGASMGGSGSYNIGLKNPNLFSGIISFFGAINMGDNPLGIALDASDEYLKYYTQYIVCGNRDLYKFGIPALTLDQRLRKAGVDHFIEIEEGGHDSSFYLPYVIDAFAYQTDAMPSHTAEEIAATIKNGSVEIGETGNKLEVAYSAKLDKSINNYLNTVPASDYTTDTNPALVVPVTVSVEQDGKTVYSKTETTDISAFSTNTKPISGTFTLESADLDLSSKYTVRVVASVLDQSVVVGTAVKLTEESSSAVADVIEKISEIGTVTENSADAIQAAQDAYDALSEEEKNMVSNASTLLDAQENYAEISGNMVTITDAKDAAAKVEKLISAIGTVTADSKSAIETARKAYDALDELAQMYVGNFATLKKAEVAYSDLTIVAEQTNSAADIKKAKENAAAVDKLVSAIGTVSLNSKDEIDAARKAYNALDDLSASYVTKYAALKNAEVSYEEKLATFKAKKPASIKVVKKGKKALKVSWKKVSGADGYVVYRSTKKSKGYKVVKTIKKASTVSFKDTGVKKGKKYYYKVCAYKTINGKKVSSKYSKVVSKKR